MRDLIKFSAVTATLGTLGILISLIGAWIDRKGKHDTLIITSWAVGSISALTTMAIYAYAIYTGMIQ